MKALRINLIITYLATIVLVFVFCTLLGVKHVNLSVEENANDSMQFMLENKTDILNRGLFGAENIVSEMDSYVHKYFDGIKYKENPSYKADFLEDMRNSAIAMSNVVKGINSAYFRPDAEVYGATEGFFIQENSGNYISVKTTDILEYERDDKEHVGWYYEPINQKKALWLVPYYNRNIGEYIMSYVDPVYIDDTFVGVVGVDVNVSEINRIINSSKYESAVGFLLSKEGDILYEKDYPEGLMAEDFDESFDDIKESFKAEYADTNENYRCIWHGVPGRIASKTLDNKMRIAIFLSQEEIYSILDAMWPRYLLMFVIALGVAIIPIIRFTGEIFNPIKAVTRAAQRMASGGLNVSLDYHSENEIGKLADSIRNISEEMKDYISYINVQTYTDAMTGVKNKGAYLEAERVLANKISEKMADFAICVFDVNGLKHMNDTFGHEYGDMFIKDASNQIKAIFGEENVYRTGGDEFVVIKEGISGEELEWMFAQFDQRINLFNRDNDRYNEELAISKGAAFYDPEEDVAYADVFAKADEQMYRDKEEYYKKHEDRRRK